jgi:hypothetical protein
VFAVACAAAGGFVEEAQASPPSNISPPTVSGSFVQGEVLTAAIGDWWGPGLGVDPV